MFNLSCKLFSSVFAMLSTKVLPSYRRDIRITIHVLMQCNPIEQKEGINFKVYINTWHGTFLEKTEKLANIYPALAMYNSLSTKLKIALLFKSSHKILRHFQHPRDQTYIWADRDRLFFSPIKLREPANNNNKLLSSCIFVVLHVKKHIYHSLSFLVFFSIL